MTLPIIAGNHFDVVNGTMSQAKLPAHPRDLLISPFLFQLDGSI